MGMHEIPEAQRSGSGCKCTRQIRGVSHGMLREEPLPLDFRTKLG
jgi:hypothetical protein